MVELVGGYREHFRTQVCGFSEQAFAGSSLASLEVLIG